MRPIISTLLIALASSVCFGQTSQLQVPSIEEIPRVGQNVRLPQAKRKNSAFVLQTKPHAVEGETYVVLTDHSDEAFLKPLRTLVAHRRGQLVRCKDLAKLHKSPQKFGQVRQSIKDLSPRFIAIAPRVESFHENMLLSMWELISTLDGDPQLDCFPGFLVASDSDSFVRLIEQSVSHTPIARADFRPFAINQVKSSRETRSLQKSAVLRKHFARADVETPIVAIYGRTATAAPRLNGDKTWNLTVENHRRFVKQLPPAAAAELAAANLVVMHGHGIPGMSCSVDIEAIPSDFQGKILLTGSCFSAYPAESALPNMKQAPGGYEVEKRDSFVLRAVDNGAIVAFGHQRLSSGFPHLYPVLENWLDGQTVGQGYQQLINGLIEKQNVKSGGFVIADAEKGERRPPQNMLMYVILGDPALQPFEPQRFAK